MTLTVSLTVTSTVTLNKFNDKFNLFLEARSLMSHARVMESFNRNGEALSASFPAHFFEQIVTDVMHQTAANTPLPTGNGLTRSEMNQLPSSETTGAQLEMSCTICMDNYELGAQIRTLPCFHFFHLECVDPWLVRNRECPVCRASAKPP